MAVRCGLYGEANMKPKNVDILEENLSRGNKNKIKMLHKDNRFTQPSSWGRADNNITWDDLAEIFPVSPRKTLKFFTAMQIYGTDAPNITDVFKQSTPQVFLVHVPKQGDFLVDTDGQKHAKYVIRITTSYNETTQVGVDIKFKEFLIETYKIDVLKKNKKPLTDKERAEVMKAKAVWHHGPNGEATPAVWKAEINGKAVYVVNTHRMYDTAETLKGAINKYHTKIKQTA